MRYPSYVMIKIFLLYSHFEIGIRAFSLLINMDFVKPDINAINRIIYYSELVRKTKLSLFKLRHTSNCMAGLRFALPSFHHLKYLELELIHAIQETQKASKRLLLPFLEGKDFGHEYLNHWVFSVDEIKNGYCEYTEIISYEKKRPKVFGHRYILLLRDYDDLTLGKFLGGSLLPYSTAVHFIDDIPKNNVIIHDIYNAITNSIKTALSQPYNKISNE